MLTAILSGWRHFHQARGPCVRPLEHFRDRPLNPNIEGEIVKLQDKFGAWTGEIAGNRIISTFVRRQIVQEIDIVYIMYILRS